MGHNDTVVCFIGPLWHLELARLVVLSFPVDSAEYVEAIMKATQTASG